MVTRVKSQNVHSASRGRGEMISDRRRDNPTHSIIRRQIQFNIIYIMRTNTEPDKIQRVAVMTVLVANIPPNPFLFIPLLPELTVHAASVHST